MTLPVSPPTTIDSVREWADNRLMALEMSMDADGLAHHLANYLRTDRAMSAGTVLAMSGDDILMDYHSCLGPIDPQVEGEDRRVPALSYLSQYEAVIEKRSATSRSNALRQIATPFG